VAIMRKGRLMHVEDMHARRNLRMLLLRFEEDREPELPADLELVLRERTGDVLLFEHRGELAPLLRWLALAPVLDVAIGTEDLRSLYDRFHGPNVPDLEVPA
jgi:ABC-2 type transport system ATP-binding protein